MTPADQEPAARDDDRPEPGPHSGPESGPESPEEIRRRFREALDRKHDSTSGRQGGSSDKDDVTTRGGNAHGPAHTQRTFRRRAGG
jgi:hypothetical protein